MEKYTWGVDGYGRQFIVDTEVNDRVAIMCCAPGYARSCIDLLIEQDIAEDCKYIIF